ncbi:3186_t:CDS:10 [Entrophospora sp. SA101]|nr:3186_t:CDS:10 [Entrophospora sp. SA101]
MSPYSHNSSSNNIHNNSASAAANQSNNSNSNISSSKRNIRKPVPQGPGPNQEPKEYFENSRTKLLIGHTKTVRTVAWNCDGRKLASGSVDKTVRLWEADQEDIKYSVKLLGHEESVDQLCWNPQSPYELATASTDKTDDKISFIDNKKNPSTLPSIVNHYFEDNDSRDEINEISWNHDCTMFFLTTGSGAIKILEWPSLKHIHTLRAGGADALVTLWDIEECSNVENGSTVYKIKTKAATNSVAWHPKGYLLAFAGDEESSIDRTYVGLKIFGFNDLNKRNLPLHMIHYDYNKTVASEISPQEFYPSFDTADGNNNDNNNKYNESFDTENLLNINSANNYDSIIEFSPSDLLNSMNNNHNNDNDNNNKYTPITLTLPNRGRAKNLLRNYYGLGPDGKKADPLDIDNAGFDTEKYFKGLLGEKHLNELMQRDNDLITEIRQLNGDMKTLVYENYSKFISATDTIEKMKNNVENMESGIKQLSSNMSNITNICDSLNSSLSSRRDRMIQLTRVHDLLKKVQFVFELPTRLNQCLNQKSYSKAVIYYVKTTKILEYYRELTIFNSIENECKEIMKKIIKNIRENMTKNDVIKEENKKDQNSNIVINKLKILNEGFLKELNKFVGSFIEIFLSPIKKDFIKSPAKSPAARNIININNINDIMKLISPNLEIEDREEIKRDLSEFVNLISNEYFDIVKNLLELPNNLNDFKPTIHLNLLNNLYCSIKSCNGLSSIGNLNDRVIIMINENQTKVFSKLFGRANDIIIDKFINYNDSGGSDDNINLLKFINKMEYELINYLTGTCLRLLEEYVKSDIIIVDEKIESQNMLLKLKIEIKKFWVLLINDMTKLGSPKISNRPNLLLLMSRVLLDFILSQDFREIIEISKDNSQKFLEKYVEIVGNEIAFIIRKFYLSPLPSLPSSTSTLANNDNDDNQSLALISPSLGINKVSPIWHEILTSLSIIEKDVKIVCEGDEGIEEIIENKNLEDQNLLSINSIKKSSYYSNSNSSKNSVNSINNNTNVNSLKAAATSPNNTFNNSSIHLISHIDKLFSDRIEIFGIVEMNRNGVMMGLIKILLKEWVEMIRLQLLTNRSFQQIQLDSEFVRIKFWKFIDDERLINTMLQELTSNAFRRCVEDPLPLENSVIKRIISSS